MFVAGVQVERQVLLVPTPAISAQVVGIPGGSEPLNVTVPVAFVLNKESPFVIVAVQVSETAMAAVRGEQETRVEVLVWTFSASAPLRGLARWVESAPYDALIENVPSVLAAGVQVAEQLLVVPTPPTRAHVVGIPVGSVPLKVTVPLGFAVYVTSVSVTVAAQDSDTPIVAVAGEQITEVEVAVSAVRENPEEVLRVWSVSPAYITMIPIGPSFPAPGVKVTLQAPAAVVQMAGVNEPLPTGLWENVTVPPAGVIVGPEPESATVAVHVVGALTAIGFGEQDTTEVDPRLFTVSEKYCAPEVLLAE
ncbi:MAG: hypothetical protein OK422_00020 [Thaumarchaeota archaeon]|nr:hypothetical protein [Nitrososphaerota archaeon]